MSKLAEAIDRLTEQQRIANLIALAALDGEDSIHAELSQWAMFAQLTEAIYVAPDDEYSVPAEWLQKALGKQNAAG